MVNILPLRLYFVILIDSVLYALLISDMNTLTTPKILPHTTLMCSHSDSSERSSYSKRTTTPRSAYDVNLPDF